MARSGAIGRSVKDENSAEGGSGMEGQIHMTRGKSQDL